MADNIIFNDIPLDIRTPGSYVEIDQSQALKGLPQERRRLLMMAEFSERGAMVRNVFAAKHLYGSSRIQPARILTGDLAKTKFGSGILAEMVEVALKNNSTSELFALPVAIAGAGGAATLESVGIMVPIPSGVSFMAGGSVSIHVGATLIATAGLTASEVAYPQNASWFRELVGPKLLTALHKNSQSNWVAAPANASANSGADWFELLHKTAITTGTAGTIPTVTLKASPSATPVTLTLSTATVVEADWTEWSDIQAVLEGYQWHSIAVGGVLGNLSPSAGNALMGNSYLVSDQIPWADDRYGPMVAEPSHVFAYTHESDLVDAIDVASSYNSIHLTAIPVPSSVSDPHRWVAAVAAVCDYQAAIDPARPLQTLVLKGVSTPDEASRHSRYVRNQLLHNKLSTWTVDAGGNVRLERVITTYTKNAAGFDDPSMLDIETKFTVDYIRFAVRQRIAQKFPRMKLADDDTQFAPGQPIVTPKIIRAELIALMREMELVGLVEGLEQFIADVQVVRSTADANRVNAVLPPDIVNQFRVFAASVQFRL